MYRVYNKRSKRNVQELFNNYEAARQYIRKQLRKMIWARDNGQPDLPMALSGYSIHRV
jgi:hypothetical protein